jgi:hypothetical protein
MTLEAIQPKKHKFYRKIKIDLNHDTWAESIAYNFSKSLDKV